MESTDELLNLLLSQLLLPEQLQQLQDQLKELLPSYSQKRLERLYQLLPNIISQILPQMIEQLLQTSSEKLIERMQFRLQSLPETILQILPQLSEDLEYSTEDIEFTEFGYDDKYVSTNYGNQSPLRSRSISRSPSPSPQSYSGSPSPSPRSYSGSPSPSLRSYSGSPVRRSSPVRKPRIVSKKSYNKKSKDIISKDVMKLIDYIFISNYWDKRKGNSILVDTQQILKWVNHFNSTNYENLKINKNKYYHYAADSDIISILKRLPNIIASNYKIIEDILILGNGKISLCGGSLVSLINTGNNHGDWDLFFHCETTDEADKLLNICLEFLENNHHNHGHHRDHIKHFRNQRVHTVEYNDLKIQFIKRVYKTKDQVLLGFDLAPCRIGYNTVDGLFATVCGGLSIVMQCFPLDTTQRSMSFGYRLSKYIGKGFSILFPGLPNKFNNDIKTPDGTLRYENNKIKFYNRGSFESDYEDNEGSHLNWVYILNKKYHLMTFEGNLNDITELSYDCIIKSIKTHALFNINKYHIYSMNVKTNKFFLDDRYKDFIDAYVINDDEKKACQIWQEKCEWYIEKGVEIAKLCKENTWKIENPGSQSFGKFNPILEHPKMWYGENYQSVEVGIKNTQFVAFTYCLNNINNENGITINIPKEIRNLICDYWLRAEVELARDYLFGLH